jgi:PAS domain S-box-containing protein
LDTLLAKWHAAESFRSRILSTRPCCRRKVSVQWVEQLIIPRSWRASRPPFEQVVHGLHHNRGRLALSLILLSIVFLPSAAAQVKETRRVLIFNDFGSISSPGIASIDHAILADLEKSPYHIEFYNENLEVTLFPDKVSQGEFRQEYIRTYLDREPDVIITVGPASLKLMLETNEGPFRNIPVVFCGVPAGMIDQLKLDARFTGVWADVQPEKTLNLALKLQPNTEHVVVTGGASELDHELEAIVREKLHNYESKIDFTYLTDLSMPALLERLKHLPSHTIVYHTAITQDAAGERFIDATQAVPMVASAANAPVFAVDDVDVGTGTVGGDVLSWAATGRDAAEMAVRVLNGEKPKDLPIRMSDNIYAFDWKALNRWGFKEGDLPPGSVVLNRQPSFWEVYRRYVIAGVFLVLAQWLVITALLRQRAERRKTQADLVRSHSQLLESEARFRLVSNTAPVMIWMSGPDKLCNYFNQPWLAFTGRSLEDELGNGWARGVHAGDLKGYLETYTVAFDQRESFQVEYRLRRHDGEYRWVFDQGVPRFNADGSFIGYIGSCIDVTERKLAEEALSTVSRKLIEAHEEERTWLARELHDDFNQRIALLAASLTHLRRALPALTVEASRQIEELHNQAASLGTDVQALSHRLHSSKLDYLGLRAAAAGFCREFSAQHGAEIDFRSDEIPKNLPKETALSLFRVLQESLQNAMKHSGSKHFQVTFATSRDDIRLTVADSGHGFDPDDAVKGRGVGLINMKERMKLVHGELSIESQHGIGTTIRANVPVNSGMKSAGAAG